MDESLFYDSISSLYDKIFPLKDVQLNLVLNNLKDKDVILDVGCATGNLAIELSKVKKSVHGVDLDEKMIELCHTKAVISGSDAIFSICDMTKLKKKFDKGSFDAIICLGNTLVHLLSPEKIRQWIESAYELLTEGGVLMVQIVNYDRILNNNIKSLSTIDNEFIRFKRIYDYESEDELICFKSILMEKSSGKEIRNEVSLYPLRSEQMFSYLKDAQFSLLGSYGSFKGDPYKVESEAFITVSEKK